MNSHALGFEWRFEADDIDLYKVGKDISYYRLKKLMPEFVWDITHLEGNPYDFSEVQTLIEGITVGGHSLFDQKQVLNQYRSLQLLLDQVKSNRFELNKKNIVSIHSVIAEEEALKWGCLRDGSVSIGGTKHKPPSHELLDDLLLDGINEIKKIKNVFERALVYFCFGSINQFFYDGNKRTSRWVMNAILMNNKFNYLSVPGNKSDKFNEVMVDFYNSKNASKVMEFMLECYAKD